MERKKNAYSVLLGKTVGKRSLVGLWSRWNDNIKIGLKGKG
jgi:hypothetical protein